MLGESLRNHRTTVKICKRKKRTISEIRNCFQKQKWRYDVAQEQLQHFFPFLAWHLLQQRAFCRWLFLHNDFSPGFWTSWPSAASGPVPACLRPRLSAERLWALAELSQPTWCLRNCVVICNFLGEGERRRWLLGQVKGASQHLWPPWVIESSLSLLKHANGAQTTGWNLCSGNKAMQVGPKLMRDAQG